MSRLACVEIRDLPLQLLLRREPGFSGRPAVVVEADRPQARILWADERARAHGILPGMRYAAGLALASDLCAGVVPPREIEAGVRDVANRLRAFGPDVEPSERDPGVFRIGSRGLDLLYPSLRLWAVRIRGALLEAGLRAAVVVSFGRFAAYALARALPEPRAWVLRTEEEERARLKRVPLARLSLPPDARDLLLSLGARTLGDLLRLPPAGIRERFGEEVYHVFRAASGEDDLPVQPAPAEETLREEAILDEGETDVQRLLFLVKPMLDRLLQGLAGRREALATLALELKLDRGPDRVERLKPAAPTLDARQILDLVLLRLSAISLASGVVEVGMVAEGEKATAAQLDLFATKARRDPAAQKRAFARLRAEFGETAIARAGLREGHLPEASFEWLPLPELPAPQPRLCRRTLVRRLRLPPFALPHRPRHEEDGWQLRGRGDASVDHLLGPYVLSGGWWRGGVAREYYFARTRSEEWLWVFRDAKRRRWFLHGRVE
ncbi:MAG TPA: DNA polymerase Y family protein [Planctomycetota bacterium]|nr:DNA polymerase Y family protein [Planctomycetota bacterium]